jgi:hypothetical protein
MQHVDQFGYAAAQDQAILNKWATPDIPTAAELLSFSGISRVLHNAGLHDRGRIGEDRR